MWISIESGEIIWAGGTCLQFKYMEGEACNHDCEVSMGETPIPSQPGVYAKILSQGKKKK